MKIDDPRALFRETIKKEFSFLKSDASFIDAISKSISLPRNQGALLPIHYGLVNDDELIKTLAIWREENSFAYCVKFKVTFDGTRNWLKNQVLDNDARILFLVIDRFGRRIGHVGLGDCMNDQCKIMVDNILRGDKTHEKGIMAEAVLELCEWARKTFLPNEIYLKVLDDNHHAVEFYKKLGFIETGKLPLVREDRGAGYFAYLDAKESQKPDRYFVNMVIPERKGFKPEKTILTAGPLIGGREVFYVNDAARNGWNEQWSGYLTRFEKKFAEYIGVKYALATSSGTGALHIALLALDIGPGDEVIIPDLTWVATGQAVNYVGAVPVFADVQKLTWCLDPDSFKKQITNKTKAVMPVHLYGHPSRMDEILPIAKKYGIKVVEDAAPSIGAEVNGKRTGSFGDFAMFSFQGAKLTVTGEGGILLTNDDKLYEKARKIWDQGRRPGTFWIDEVGWKYKMSNVQAALGLGQLEHVEQLVAAKRQIFSWYEEFLSDCPYIELNREAAWARSIYWMSSILLNADAPLNREELIRSLKDNKIDSRPVFPSMSLFDFWPKKQRSQENAFYIGNHGINLPSGVCLKREEVKYVCDTIKRLLS
ncbi:MAG: GNAT family N-acetyltransferase [Candidatus Omnitrophota bacterium]